MLDTLLLKTSRTFALSIPLLPDPARTEITVAYLLFRIADTLEDETAVPLDARLTGMRLMRSMLADGEADDVSPDELFQASFRGDVSDASYVELLEEARTVFAEFRALSPEAQAVISRHLCRTIDGMADYMQRENGPSSLDQLREYCYYVAGIVGELCTEVFDLHAPGLGPSRDRLMELAPSFGEGLQLVNILRDEQHDDEEGRRYIPRQERRPMLITIAADDLQKATEYVSLLEDRGVDPGIVAFNSLNLTLAFSTLARVREHGPGVKLTREEVLGIFETIKEITPRRESVIPMIRRTGAPLVEVK